MSHLKTGWLCVATEGDTVDGRVIERQLIVDMGETYDANHYAALLWPEHERGYGNFGEVLEAEWHEGEDGLVRLFVSIRPNKRLIYANEDGQLLYFSVEPELNWRGGDRTYLMGLAVTDNPASTGTTRLRFSRRHLNKQGYYSGVISQNGTIKQDGLMKNWQKLFGLKPKFETETPPEDTQPSDDKLQALASAVNELEARIGVIEGKLNSVQDDVETISEAVDTEEFAAIRDNAKEIVTRFNDLGNKDNRQQRKIPSKAGKFNYL